MENILIFDEKAAGEIWIADTFIKRFLGFMFRKRPHHDAILFSPCNSIHTFFMHFPIDVLFLNENWEVIKKVEGIKPRKIIMPQKNAKMVIEAREGMFHSIKEGKKIYIIK